MVLSHDTTEGIHKDIQISNWFVEHTCLMIGCWDRIDSWMEVWFTVWVVSLLHCCPLPPLVLLVGVVLHMYFLYIFIHTRSHDVSSAVKVQKKGGASAHT
jgi:hypothetical protein